MRQITEFNDFSDPFFVVFASILGGFAAKLSIVNWQIRLENDFDDQILLKKIGQVSGRFGRKSQIFVGSLKS